MLGAHHLPRKPDSPVAQPQFLWSRCSPARLDAEDGRAWIDNGIVRLTLGVFYTGDVPHVLSIRCIVFDLFELSSKSKV